MGDLIFKPTTGGSLKLQEDGGTDAISISPAGVSTITNATITAGTLGDTFGGNAVGFRAQRTATQAIAHQTLTTVICNNDSTSGWTYDTRNWYDTSTGKYTPQIAGYYWIQGHIGWLNDITDQIVYTVGLAKNGADAASTFIRNASYQSVTNGGQTSQISEIVYLNGSSDYVLMNAYHGNGNSRTIYGTSVPNADSCSFSGFLIR